MSVLAPDKHLEHWIASHRVDAIDHVSLFLSRIGTLGGVWIVLGVALALLWRRPFLALPVVVAVLGADFAADVFKLFIYRHRPFEHQIGPSQRTHSFPSGHTATSFAGAFMLSALAPRFRPVFYVLAVLIGLSRLYNGVHYPTDVLAGAALGTLVALAVQRGFRHWSGGTRSA